MITKKPNNEIIKSEANGHHFPDSKGFSFCVNKYVSLK